MAKLKQDKWTLVQHSGFGYGEKPQFATAVEIRSISTKKELDLVNKVGGIVYDSYKDAMEADDMINGVNGDRPFLQVAGTFSDHTIDDLRIYIPKREVVG